MRKIVFILIVILLLSSNQVWAVVASPSTALKTSSPSGSLKKPAVSEANRVENLKERVDNEITRRITALNKLIDRINSAKRLTAAQKLTLTTQINDEVAALTTLNTKIAGDADLTSLKVDVAKIVKSYRIFALYIPKIHILTASEIILDITDQLTVLLSKFQTYIAQNPSKLRDLPAVQSAITEMQTKIADAKTQAENAQTTVLPLTPEGYPENKTKLDEARKMLVAARQDLAEARQAAAKIRGNMTAVSSLKSIVPLATGSASPAASASGKASPSASSAAVMPQI